MCLRLEVNDVLAAVSYLSQRDRLHPPPSEPAVFTSTSGTRLLYDTILKTFRRLVRQAGLKPRSARCRPGLHSLRHTFAVRTVLEGYETGGDVHGRLAPLSTYMGHVNPGNTYWYLSASPELLALAAQRLERHLGDN
jgi:integrase/recombinase XerD